MKDPRPGYQVLPGLQREVTDPVHRTNSNDAEVISIRSRELLEVTFIETDIAFSLIRNPRISL